MINNNDDEILDELGLKEFQKKTVNSVLEKFDSSNRVLVADEVGLGKTLIAEGVIAKLLKNKKSFKVIYLAPNNVISIQNLPKLSKAINDIEKYNNTTRLSLLTYEMWKKNYNRAIIALTPETSFNIKNERGIKDERKLIYSVLAMLKDKEGNLIFKDGDNINWLQHYLYKYLRPKAKSLFSGERNDFLIQIKRIRRNNERYNNNSSKKTIKKYKAKIFRNYIESIQNELINKLENKCEGNEEQISIKEKLQSNSLKEYADFLEQNKDNKIKEKLQGLSKEKQEEYKELNKLIVELRKIFSEVGFNMLKPDLIIMDEFHQYKELDKQNPFYYNELFKDSRILMLSATPFKMNQIDEDSKKNYQNFLKLMEFLINDEEKYLEFEKDWKERSNCLKEFCEKKDENIDGKRNYIEKLVGNIENTMRQHICRTERTEKMEIGIKEEKKEENNIPKEYKIPPSSNNIKEYLQLVDLINVYKKNIKKNYKKINNFGPIMDFCKSCPYLLSFASDYNINELKKALKDVKDLDKYDSLILKQNEKKDCIENVLKESKLYKINEMVLPDGMEYLLWLPPTIKYYKEKNSPFNIEREKIGKTLIFSRWKMIPKMISSVISNERDTRVSKAKIGQNLRTDQLSSWYMLIYPSFVLAELYNPLEKVFFKKNGNCVKREIGKKLIEKIDEICNNDTQNDTITNSDIKKIIHFLPLILDYMKNPDYLTKFLNNISKKEKTEDGFFIIKSKTKENNQGQEIEDIKNIINEYAIKLSNNKNIIKKYIKNNENQKMDLLYNYIIASPANCVYRYFIKNEKYEGYDFSEEAMETAIYISESFKELFNKADSSEIIKNFKCNNTKGIYAERMLHYCYLGNLQAVLDEYFFLLDTSKEDRHKVIKHTMENALNVRGSHKISIIKEDNKFFSQNINTNIAQSFNDTIEREENKDNIGDRKVAFNSPFWPFILTTTNIGKEGLDFHYYCDSVIHWNEPPLAIDIEQREGRVDRYNSYSVRKAIVNMYSSWIEGKEKDKNVLDEIEEQDIWKTVFTKANKERKDSDDEFFPNWRVKNQKIKITHLLYGFSNDINKYITNKKILKLYRFALGSSENPWKIIKGLVENKVNDEDLKKFKINLLPDDTEKE